MSETFSKGVDALTEVFNSQKHTSSLWKSQPLRTRKARLVKIKDWIQNHRADIQEALYADFKKPAAEVDLSEIYVVLSEIRHAMKNLSSWTKPEKVASPSALIGSKSQVQLEPKGVCLIISPWNFPFNLTVGPLISALAAGNTVILKPSELTPNCSNLIDKMITELFDPSEVAVFQGGKELATELLQLSFDHIFFTGSPRVGKVVMRMAADQLTSVTLELGGKSPAIVHKSANLQDAAEKLVWGKFLNCGQTCIAPDYILVDERVEAELIDNICYSIDRFFDPEGEGIQNSNSYARIISDQHFDRLDGLLTDSLKSGAVIEYGGTVDKSDRYFSPTIISNLTNEIKVMQEEIFGPLLPVIPYQHLDEVVETINTRPKPLALYIFTQSTEFKSEVLNRTSSGSVAINDCVIQFMNPNLPFGGINHSGFGKSHGYHGFLAFSNQKSILVQKTGVTSVKPMFPPYTSLTKKAIDFLLRYL